MNKRFINDGYIQQREGSNEVLWNLTLNRTRACLFLLFILHNLI
jgi:hypothetical protein